MLGDKEEWFSPDPRAVADELGSRFPLRLVLDCLAVDTRSPDPRRAATARALRQERPAGSIFADSDPVFGAVDRLVALVALTGLLLGHKSPVLQSAASRLSEQTNWRTVQFLLENAVFLLIGLQLPSIVAGLAALVAQVIGPA